MLMLPTIDVGCICNEELCFKQPWPEEAVGDFDRRNLLVLFLV